LKVIKAIIIIMFYNDILVDVIKNVVVRGYDATVQRFHCC